MTMTDQATWESDVTELDDGSYVTRSSMTVPSVMGDQIVAECVANNQALVGDSRSDVRQVDILSK